MNISFLGYGNMAKAIAQTLVCDSSYSLSAAAPSLPDNLKTPIKTYSDNTKAVKQADIIILAVKPFQMSLVLKEIKPHIKPGTLLISVAAGLDIAWLSSHCKVDQALVRAMPNTPASVGYASTPLFANSHTTEQQRQQAQAIFSKIGFSSWLTNEEDMDSLTALSGSGPAYVFSFIEALVDAGINLGLDPDTAEKYVLHTVEGSLKLAQNKEVSVKDLRAQVTSPGGTTAAALHVLHDALQDLVLLALEAAKKRAQELGKLL